MTPAELKEARHRAGFTQEKMADALGLSKNHLSAMERGAKAITQQTEIITSAILAFGHPNSWPKP